MKALKIIALIIAAVLILFGVLFILAAFSPESQGSPGGLILTGLILAGIGFVLIFVAFRFLTPAAPGPGTQVTLKIDLPGKVAMETIKCQSCGGVLSSDDIKIVNGAAMVSCPYCKTTYQISEEPKW
ncbi:MAG: hypothetical protein LDL12_07890 [Anaerolinea sp.]|nr:hypothetical protein [Anaerolinea sp.]